MSAFTSSYVYNWNKYFDGQIKGDDGIEYDKVDLKYPPSFDGRCVLYPTQEELIDYFKWRQVDCHINNLYNTAFHALTGEYVLNPYSKSKKEKSLLPEHLTPFKVS